MSRRRRPLKLTRLPADHARDEADRAALRRARAAHQQDMADLAATQRAELQRSAADARPGRQCRDCGNRIGSAACVKACGGAR